jgi:hypothetical protein
MVLSLGVFCLVFQSVKLIIMLLMIFFKHTLIHKNPSQQWNWTHRPSESFFSFVACFPTGDSSSCRLNRPVEGPACCFEKWQTTEEVEWKDQSYKSQFLVNQAKVQA